LAYPFVPAQQEQTVAEGLASLETVFVADPRALSSAVAAIRDADLVGFDTEFVGESTYEPELCLLQVSTAERIFVIDPLASLQLDEFWQALTDSSLQVVAVAARQELLFCLRYANRLPGRVFDPQVAAGLLGFSYPLSHTNLVQQVLRRRIEGSQAYTDWRKRPLAPRQLGYAADDVRFLLGLRETLLARATEMGRDGWLKGEMSRLAQRIAEADQEERWWRVSGASGLDRRALGVLREVWRWRDTKARAANSPPRRIMGDELMVQVARRAPRSENDLFALRSFDRPQLRRSGPEIVAAVQTALELPESQLPNLTRVDDPPQVPVLTQFASVLANNAALEHQVDMALLATTADLQDFVRWRLGVSEDAEPALMEGWRGEILGRQLAELLDGQRVIRVADATSRRPLRVELIDKAT
jgi:ribonuclease D